MKAVKEVTGLHPGETDKERIFTFSEVECLGACVNGIYIPRSLAGMVLTWNDVCRANDPG